MRARSLRLAAVVGFACIQSGCAFLLFDDGGLTTGSTADAADEVRGSIAKDAGVDPTTDSSATDGGSSEGGVVELLENPSFEVDGLVCGPRWTPAPSTSIDRTEGRSGRGCRVCRRADVRRWIGVQQIFNPPLPPGRYRMSARYRAVGTVPASQCEIGVDIELADAGRRQAFSNACDPNRTDWHELVHEASIEAGEKMLDFYVAALATESVCFDVDDVSLTVVP